ncbi:MULTISPECIES: hypothetical protein [unclassified Pedobacter]|uniref:hypothetical protein n=1 Tax=unclassified Pedobacter TaxID=2628915 RepID=UPI000B4AB0FB|nr:MULTISPECIES: hypothetical protein [unclassified Pedobacter]MCX2584052.1 hypothetical protein [Pedobacter sp. MR22-3]OWK69653.1 hypothetical protein CBW18_16040 [Pedobacter sp. AJM]
MIKRLSSLLLLLVLFIGCKKKDLPPEIKLFDDQYKNLQLNSGFKNNNFTINGSDWSVEYVKDALSGEVFLDQAGKPAILKSLGSVSLQNGWLKLERKQAGDQLILSLEENLSTHPRKFLIGILSDGNRGQLSFTQSRGQGYAIVNKQITEIPGSRKEYTTNEGLYPVTVTNNDWVAKYVDISDIYREVKHMSEFTSDDDNAFNWVNTQDTTVFMQDILIDNKVYWSQSVPYKKGQSLTPYVKTGGGKIEMLVKANSSVNVKGKITYLSRESDYSFTIKNLTSGNTFDVSGKWKQKVPISTSVEIY